MKENKVLDSSKILIARNLILRIHTITEKGCCLINGSNQGYGQVNINGDIQLAHRVSYELFKGPLNNLHCCHSCDQPNCINPDHLFAGTAVDNMVDMLQKQRSQLQILTVEQVREIKASLKRGSLPQGIAKKYNVSASCIRNIKTGKRWGHII